MASLVELDYYELTRGFCREVWRKFVRKHLKLDNELEKLETKYPEDFEEQKIQIVKHWQKLDERHTEACFRQLKHDFFCGSKYHGKHHYTQLVSASADDSAIPAKSQKVGAGPQLEYPQRNGRGLALIIGNSFTNKFKKKHQREPACTKDLENMANLWKGVYGCDLLGGEVHKDKKAAEMRDLMKEMAEEGGAYHFVVVVISTHGGSKPIGKAEENRFMDCLLGDDGFPIDIRDLQKFFRNDEAKKLQNIPKLFILQYCRGGLIDQGVLRASSDTRDPAGAFGEDESRLLPTISDIASVFATQASYTAWKSEEGSWLLTKINEVFRQYSSQQLHVIDMLTIVNDHMKNHRGEYAGKDAKAMSIVESSFTKQLRLIPTVDIPREEEQPIQPAE